MTEKMEANFSILVMSVASSAAMSLGMTPHPQTQELQKDKELAKFNIDLLIVLQDKTKNNLSADEKSLIDNIVSDLQMKFTQTSF